MFVQVIQGPVGDREQAIFALRRWEEELGPGAAGWLGSTAGVTADGTLVATARFESEEAARRNSERPEQGEWWAETEKLFTGEVTFRDSTYVDVDIQADPSDAGFVQVMQGRGTDPERAREIMRQDAPAWAAFRPEVQATLMLGHRDGGFTMVIYFPSELAAREGEAKRPPPELTAHLDELNALSIGEPEFFDLSEPWLASP